MTRLLGSKRVRSRPSTRNLRPPARRPAGPPARRPARLAAGRGRLAAVWRPDGTHVDSPGDPHDAVSRPAAVSLTVAVLEKS